MVKPCKTKALNYLGNCVAFGREFAFPSLGLRHLLPALDGLLSPTSSLNPPPLILSSLIQALNLGY